MTGLVLDYVALHTAGSPTDEAVKWTHLRPCDIALHLSEVHELNISHGCIKRILRADNYVRRKPVKTLAVGKSPVRNEQFELIFFLIALFSDMGHNPIMSIDTKKKEALGQLTRNETVLCRKDAPPEVYDHDFSYLATGKAVPHGIYDIKANKGYISIGNSHETAAFVVDNLEWWWNEYGQHKYPDATAILILCDSGGANGYRHHLFKKLLQDWAEKIGKRIVVAHYPPYCSKYNPIERKLFAHVHRTIRHTVLTELSQIKELVLKTSTKQGLTIEVRINDTFYPTKRLSKPYLIDAKRILRHPDSPNLSYTVLP